ncbi:hypothetical protein CAEBREN_01955 [Caenorhabditis brenneri]|uniref:Saposin B-type domain-containing protein n=1 Tax=Caenorhabditis brenneri TaxID=135651 RepID=G0MEY7_CAEBE|nr:hypothetical protein CAEBREN_01955 [Caenorhabditis brenneri]
MKFLLAILLIFFFKPSLSFDACRLCTFITVPTTWEDAALLAKAACSRLGVAKGECHQIVDNADLTSSYPNMYPHIVNLKDIVCGKYCKKY